MAGSEQDRLYAARQARPVEFVFDARVARVFPDMIRRSVPGYATILDMIASLAGRQGDRGGRCYDLGCSLGAAALAMHQGLAGRKCRIVGVDNSLAMLRRARELIDAQAGPTAPIDLVCADVRDVMVRDAAMVVLNFTLQFIPLGQRDELMQRIHEGVAPGGLLVLSEKIAPDDPRTGELFVEMHHAFKRAQGYSGLEISQKRAALDRVLIPESLEAHRQRLQAVGFTRVEPWFQWCNFASLLAFKA